MKSQCDFNLEDGQESAGDCDSLFSSSEYDDDGKTISEEEACAHAHHLLNDGASTEIPGLYFYGSLLPISLEGELLTAIRSHKYLSPCSGRNQAMLFGSNSGSQGDDGGLPSWLNGLITWLKTDKDGLCGRLANEVDSQSLQKLFFPDKNDTRSRQAIINHYTPPEGITSHIDLVTRFDDGIIILSLFSGIGMQFSKGSEMKRIYLPPLSCVLLTGQARWEWTHGIEEDTGDWVKGDGEGDEWIVTHGTTFKHGMVWVPREERTSLTIRWITPGADVVGN